ncbi:MAG: D-aminoacyl-tRNA deacylase [Chloroflexota bacterium]|jgi:D-tyrosyl-tRNA(Tyr) deacylase|nr:D-aminoacyl-tRNA deacylase [Chloroflexota bacterium]
MRLLLQRATRAEVRVEGKVVGSIGPGLVALVGIGHGDDEATVETVADKTVDLRIFRDTDGKTNLSLADVGGAVLAISQFTLYADTRKGRRPSFLDAAPPDVGVRLYVAYCAAVEARGIKVARGVFGAEMEVELVNDGPMTIWLDSAAGAASPAG